jgi:hypothetical protein
MSSIKTLLTGTFWLTAASTVLAHPGHGPDGGSYSPAHYLTQPQHLLAGVVLASVVLVAGAWSVRLWRSTRQAT